MAHAMTSMDLDMDDSHFGIDGIVRVVYVAAAIAIWRTTTYMLAPAGAVDTGVAVEKETIGPHTEEHSFNRTNILALGIFCAIAHNFLHIRRSNTFQEQHPASAKEPTGVRANEHTVGTREIFDAVAEGKQLRLAELLEQSLTLDDGITPRTSRTGIDFVSPIGRRTALIEACVRARSTLARMLLDAGADCSFVDNSGRTARDWVKLWSPEAVDADGRAVISLLEARYRRRVARRRWKVFGRSVEALLSLWALIKERRYAPDGAGFEVARMHFEDCRTAMEQGGDTYRVSARRETTPHRAGPR